MFYLAQMSSVHVVIKDASILNPDTTSTNANLSTALGCVLCKGLQTGTKGKQMPPTPNLSLMQRVVAQIMCIYM
jgi:hypothetical protein